MNKTVKNSLILVLLTLLVAASVCVSLFYNVDDANKQIILHYIRIPNVIKSVIAGSTLALAGMILQTISKNPLADPYITGLSSGAGLGIVLSILCFSGMNYSVFGFLGALITAFLVILLNGFSKFSISKLILIGLSINIFSGALISFLILMNPEKTYAMTLILSGGYSSADISNKFLVILFLVAIFVCAIFVPKFNVLRIDSKLLFSNDLRLKYNVIFVILAAFLTSISVLTAGILGFVGIITPILAKLLVGNDFRFMFFVNILLGSLLLLVSNYIATNLVYPLQIPLGVVVAFVGAPVFVFFLLKKGGIFND